MDEIFIKEYPFEFEALDSKENQDLIDNFTGYPEEFFRIGPKKFFFQKGILLQVPHIHKLSLKCDDTFVVTYPKSGTTLTQELVWLICNNLDYERAQSIVLNERFPFLEVSALVPPNDHFTEELKDVVKQTIMPITVQEMPSPRFIKSHLPLSILPPSLLDTTKVVYVARDPRDVAVSFYHHNKLMKVMRSDLEFKSFWNYFVSNKIMWGPYFEHLFEAWEQRNNPNMLFLFYEDMIKDLPKVIERVATFFGKKLTENQMIELVNHLDIDNFKKNKSVNMDDMRKHGIFSNDETFIRKGKSGGWRNYFDEEMTAQADEWIAKHLRGTDFRFPHF